MDGHRGGWIEIIAGGMFSGKSEELIRRMRRAVIARQRVQVFKPALDDRFGDAEVVSRDHVSRKSSMHKEKRTTRKQKKASLSGCNDQRIHEGRKLMAASGTAVTRGAMW